MLTFRLFNLFIAIVIAIPLAVTIREAAATAGILSQTDAVKESNMLECASLPSRHSIRAEYVEEAGISIIRTEDGPTGVDGGLIELLSSYRICER